MVLISVRITALLKASTAFLSYLTRLSADPSFPNADADAVNCRSKPSCCIFSFALFDISFRAVYLSM